MQTDEAAAAEAEAASAAEEAPTAMEAQAQVNVYCRKTSPSDLTVDTILVL